MFVQFLSRKVLVWNFCRYVHARGLSPVPIRNHSQELLATISTFAIHPIGPENVPARHTCYIFLPRAQIADFLSAVCIRAYSALIRDLEPGLTCVANAGPMRCCVRRRAALCRSFKQESSPSSLVTWVRRCAGSEVTITMAHWCVRLGIYRANSTE